MRGAAAAAALRVTAAHPAPRDSSTARRIVPDCISAIPPGLRAAPSVAAAQPAALLQRLRPPVLAAGTAAPAFQRGAAAGAGKAPSWARRVTMLAAPAAFRRGVRGPAVGAVPRRPMTAAPVAAGPARVPALAPAGRAMGA